MLAANRRQMLDESEAILVCTHWIGLSRGAKILSDQERHGQCRGEV
jgi:hypothetical protein